ncbi:MAG: alpha/beta fold hydrolase, partial [Pseudomonadales bacterium]
AWRRAYPDRWAALLEMAGSGLGGPSDPVAAAGARAQLQARAGHDTWGRLQQLQMPVLLAGGRFDGIAPPDNLRAMERRINAAQLMMFDGGHLFMIQDKTAYPAIIDWLADHR